MSITEVISDLVAAATSAAGQPGRVPAVESPAGRELVAEQQRFAGKSAWRTPVRDTHTLGGVTLRAAGDHLRGFASLIDQDGAANYAHLVLARAAMEACVIAAWLSGPAADADERVKRGLVERLYSARRQQQSEPLRPRGEALDAQLNTVATALRWTVTTGRTDGDPVVGGVGRPDVASSLRRHLDGDRMGHLGQVLWGRLSGVTHAAWYALAQTAVEAPPEDATGIRAPLPGTGTDSVSLDLQAVCLIRLYAAAVDDRLALMGWDSAVWLDARRRAEALHDALVEAMNRGPGRPGG